MAWRAFASKPDNQSSVPRTYTGSYMSTMVHVNTHTQYEQSVIFLFLVINETLELHKVKSLVSGHKAREWMSVLALGPPHEGYFQYCSLYLIMSSFLIQFDFFLILKCRKT